MQVGGRAQEHVLNAEIVADARAAALEITYVAAVLDASRRPLPLMSPQDVPLYRAQRGDASALFGMCHGPRETTRTYLRVVSRSWMGSI